MALNKTLLFGQIDDLSITLILRVSGITQIDAFTVPEKGWCGKPNELYTTFKATLRCFRFLFYILHLQ